MRVEIRDAKAMRSIGLFNLVAYLRAKGWREEVGFPTAVSWGKQTESGTKYEVLLPVSDEVRDYSLRLAEIVATLEVVESRSQVEIVRDLTLASADVLRFTLPVPDDAESVPLTDGVALVENARSLLFSAATTTVMPRRVLPPRRPAEAIEYIHRVRLGHTERGSYVVTIVSPVAPLLTPGAPGLLEMMGEPFPRRVTTTLALALVATKRAAADAASSGSFDAFEAAVASGVSANLFDAIVGMAQSEESIHSVSVRFSWASARPQLSTDVDSVLFREDSIPVIQEAARVFREEEPFEEVFVVGSVVNLHRDRDDQPGTATVCDAVSCTNVRRLGADVVRVRLVANARREAEASGTDAEPQVSAVDFASGFASVLEERARFVRKSWTKHGKSKLKLVEAPGIERQPPPFQILLDPTFSNDSASGSDGRTGSDSVSSTDFAPAGANLRALARRARQTYARGERDAALALLLELAAELDPSPSVGCSRPDDDTETPSAPAVADAPPLSPRGKEGT